MKTEKCKEMMERVLAGDRSPEVMEHLASCAGCRDLAALDRMVTGTSEPMSVPPDFRIPQAQAVLPQAAGIRAPLDSFSFCFSSLSFYQELLYAITLFYRH